jgi:DNA-binding response OmpR family regulator
MTDFDQPTLDLPAPHFLLAINNRHEAEELRQTLAILGWTSLHVSHFQQARQALEDHHYVGLIVDMLLEGGSGFQLLQMLPEYPWALQSVIMVSELASQAHATYALSLGAHLFLAKPVPRATLLELLKNEAVAGRTD